MEPSKPEIKIMCQGLLEKRSKYWQWQTRFFQILRVKPQDEAAIYFMHYYQNKNSADRDKLKDNDTTEKRVKIDMLDVHDITAAPNSPIIELYLSRTRFMVRVLDGDDVKRWTKAMTEAREGAKKTIPKIKSDVSIKPDSSIESPPQLKPVAQPSSIVLALEVTAAFTAVIFSSGCVLFTSKLWTRQGLPSLFGSTKMIRLIGGHVPTGCDDMTAMLALVTIALIVIGALFSMISESFADRAALKNGKQVNSYKPIISGSAFGISIAFSFFFMVQGLHDLSVDMWAIHGMTSPDLAVAQERLVFWRHFHTWRQEEFIFKHFEREAKTHTSHPSYGNILLVLGGVMCVMFTWGEMKKVIGCFRQRAPLAYHFGDLAYFFLLFILFPPLIMNDLLPLEERARTCHLPQQECPLHNEQVCTLGSHWPQEDDSKECVHVAVDLTLIHFLKVVIQLGMLIAVLTKFSASQRAERRPTLHAHGGKQNSILRG